MSNSRSNPSFMTVRLAGATFLLVQNVPGSSHTHSCVCEVESSEGSPTSPSSSPKTWVVLLIASPSYISGKQIFILSMLLYFCCKFLIADFFIFYSVREIVTMIKASLVLLQHSNACWDLGNCCPIFISTIDSYCLEAHFSYLKCYDITYLDKK